MDYRSFYWNNFFISGDPMYYLMLRQKALEEKKTEEKTEAEKEQILIENLQSWD